MFEKVLQRFISLLTRAAIAFLALSALVLLGIAVATLLRPLSSVSFVLQDVLLAIALGVISVGVGDLALTISREETLRRANPRNPVITADLVARFLFVIVTTLGIDNLFTVVRAEVQEDTVRLLVAAGLVIATAILAVATAYFRRQTRPAPGQRESEQSSDDLPSQA